MPNETWKAQYYKTNRWYDRIIQNKYKHYDPDLIKDDVNTFFINCYHLSDWLKEGSSLGKPFVDDWVNNNEYLQVCRALANGEKHLHCTNKEAVKYPVRSCFRLSNNQVNVASSTGASGTYDINNALYDIPILDSGFQAVTQKINLMQFIVTYKGKEYDIYELAYNCIEAWNQFLKENRLI